MISRKMANLLMSSIQFFSISEVFNKDKFSPCDRIRGINNIKSPTVININTSKVAIVAKHV